MDESAARATLSAPKKIRKKSKGSLGQHPGRRTQKKQRVGFIVASFPSKRDPSSMTSVVDQASNDISISPSKSYRPHEKHLRNRANYAKRQCVKKEEQVKKLLVEQYKIKESQHEQEKAHNDINIE